MRKIDIFNHIMPAKFFARLGDCKDIGKRMREVPMLFDLDVRFRVMDRFPGYVQVLCAGMPPIAIFLHPARGADFADLCDGDEIALRDVVGVRLAVRDERGDGPARVRGNLRAAS